MFLRRVGEVASHKNPLGVAVCPFFTSVVTRIGGVEQRRAKRHHYFNSSKKIIEEKIPWNCLAKNDRFLVKKHFLSDIAFKFSAMLSEEIKTWLKHVSTHWNSILMPCKKLVKNYESVVRCYFQPKVTD